MDLVIYLSKLVHIVLDDGYYYIGKVVSADENSLTLIDKTNKRVSISGKAIATIREIASVQIKPTEERNNGNI